MPIVDRCSGLLEAIAVRDMSAKTVADILWSRWITRFGVPEKIISDRGPAFSNILMEEFQKRMGFSLTKISPYHPRANGGIERHHRTLHENLLLYTKKSSSRDKNLDAFVFFMRNTVRDGEGYSPAYLAFGTELRVPADLLKREIQ